MPVDERKRPMLRRGPGPRRFEKTEYADDIGQTVRWLLSYFGSARLLLAGILVAVVLQTGASTVLPLVQARAIDAITAGGGARFFTHLSALGALFAFSSLMTLWQKRLSAYLSQHMVRRLRTDLFRHIVDLPIRYLDTHSHGDIMSRMTNDVENLSDVISSSLAGLLSGVLTIAGTVLLMLYTSWQLALVSFLSVFLTMAATKFLSRKVRQYSWARQKLLGEETGLAEEMITGFRTVTAYHHQAAVIRRFVEKSDHLTKAGIRQEVFSGVMGPVMNGIDNLGFVACAAAGGFLATQGLVSIGTMAAFFIYIRLFSRPLNEIAMIYGSLQSAIAGAERVFRVLDEAGEDLAGGSYPPPGRHDVTFDHVHFSYTEEHEVIHDFSLTVPATKKVALVGATGSGKTTMVNLLMRFYDVDSGRIAIGGQDIRTIARHELRRHVAIVLQDTVLFTGTVRENLLYARPDATDEELRRAARLSHADAMLREMPAGYDTELTEGGSNISQGQRQLLTITRAFLAAPDILIFDEAMSNVDTRTERAIQTAMQKLMECRTSIVIAHRLSTIRDADLIVVMDLGRIVEKGTHEDLLAAKGHYYALYQTQFRGLVT